MTTTPSIASTPADPGVGEGLMGGQWMPGTPTAESYSSSSTLVETNCDLKPYGNYIVVAKREALAKMEFEMQMAERQLRLKELDKSLQKYVTPRMSTYTLPYMLNERQLQLASQRFPRTIFKCALDSAHDHPLAHLETMIAADRAVRMIPSGQLVVDLYGSPKKDAAWQRQQQRSNNPKRFVSYVKRCTEKDYIRALDWAPHPYVEGDNLLEDVYSMPQLQSDEPMTFLLVNTLYYVTQRELLVALARGPGRRAVCVIHRHPADKGTMFDGEMTYAKIGDSVEQVNVETGERYVHPDLSWIFNSKTKCVTVGAGTLVWTLHKVTAETWIVVFAVGETKDERFWNRAKAIGMQDAGIELNEHSLHVSKYPHPALAKMPNTKSYLLGGVPVLKLDGCDMPPLRITCPELVDFLSLHTMGKPRDGQRLQDLFALARMHVYDGSEFAGKRNFKVDAKDVYGHVLAAFLSGLDDETVYMRAVSTYQNTMREHSALLDGAAVLVDNGATTTRIMAQRTLSAIKEGGVLAGALKAIE